LAALGLGILVLSGGKARAAGFPSRPVQLLVPFPPGGGVDTIARAVADRMAAQLGVSVLVDNRPGGSTSIASAQVARAEPDGHTILIGTPALSINPVLQPDLPPGDPRRALAPIGRVATLPYVLVAGPGLPVTDVPGLIAWAKAHPGALNLANTGAATAVRMAGELLAQQAGLQLVQIPYKGGAAAALDITAGRVHGSFAQTIEAMGMQRNGARILAVSSLERNPAFPGVPAMAEFLPGFDVTSWNGLYAPAGTPSAIIARLNAVLNHAIEDAGLRERFAQEGITFQGGEPALLARQLDAEIRKWEALRDSAGLRAEAA
jgi:tripartite-type tricarboxylate transporter receptor subunit TctC